MSSRTVLIANPSSVNHASKKYRQLLAAINEKKLGWDCIIAPRGKIKETIQEKLASGATQITLFGGDGTVNESLDLLKNSEANLAIIPAGTGNDTARGLNIPLDVEKALDMAANGHSRKIDVGECNGKTFINIAGIGFDANVVRNGKKNKRKGIRGSSAYLLGVAQELRHLESVHAEIFLDGQEYPSAKKYLMVDVCNGRYIGGGICASPQADFGDGFFDVCLVEELNRRSFVQLFPDFRAGKHEKLSHVVQHQNAKEVAIQFSHSVTLQIDGELSEGRDLMARIIPAALSVRLAPIKK